MSVMKKVWDRAKQNLSMQNGRGNKIKNRAGLMTGTDFAYDMDELFNDLSTRKVKQITERMATQVRKQAVANLKKGSTADRIGRSQYGKMTRGDWRNPKTSKSGYKYLKGGWRGEVLEKRGADKPSMAYNGGSVKDSKSGGRGERGIITKNIKQRNGGWRTITGPRYGTDDTDNDKYGYNYAHVLEHGGAHKNWGEPAKALPARPFLGPAGDAVQGKNAAIMNDMLKKWAIGQ
jgi:hypothetical protein